MSVSNSKQIKSRGQGTIRIPLSGVSASVTIPEVNPSRTVLKLLGLKIDYPENYFSESMARLWLTNSTTITAVRGTLGSASNALDVAFEYVEYF